MKNESSVETFLVSIIGLAFVLILTFSDQSLLKPRSYGYDHGQVNAASIETTTYTEVNSKDVFDMLNKNDPNIILIDVSNTYKLGHIPKAINIPLKEIDKIAFGMDKNKTYLIYCRNNTDSLVAIQKLVGLGFQKLYRLSGGYNSWIGSKYKVEK